MAQDDAKDEAVERGTDLATHAGPDVGHYVGMDLRTGMTSRRAALALGAAGVVGALAGCQVYGRPQPAAPPPPPPPVASPTDGAGGGDDEEAVDEGDGGDDGGDDGGGGTPVASVDEVPVGGGVIREDQEVVITQPTAGVFVGFSAICTHAGCTVNEVADGTINCPCHFSRFSIVDGSVVQAANVLPAGANQDPLPQVPIVVDGDTIAIT